MTYIRGVDVLISTENSSSGIATGSGDNVDQPVASEWTATDVVADFWISPLANDANAPGVYPWNMTIPGNEKTGTCSATPLDTVGGVEYATDDETEVIEIFGQHTKPEVLIDDNFGTLKIPMLESTDEPWEQLLKYAPNGVTGSAAGIVNRSGNVTIDSGYRIFMVKSPKSDNEMTGSGNHWSTFLHCKLKSVEPDIRSEETNRVMLNFVYNGFTASDRPYTVSQTVVS